jgi:hypothetical protein
MKNFLASNQISEFTFHFVENSKAKATFSNQSWLKIIARKPLFVQKMKKLA